METKSIKVPSNWNEVTLTQFDRLLELSNDKDLTVAEREIKLIAVLTGLSYSEVANLDAPSFQAISNSLGFLNTKPEKIMPKVEFELNGKKYHADLYPKNFLAAQFLDYKVIAGGEIDKKSARMLACFIYPSGAKYNDGSYDVEDVVNDINEYMTVSEVTGYTDFFMLQYKAYSDSLLAYSIRTIKKSKEISQQEKKEILKKLEQGRALINSFGTSE